MFALHRLLIASLCYLLSAYALIAPFALAKSGHWLWFWSMVFAWLAHAVMTYGWIIDKKVRRFWPIAGTFAGVASLTWGPVSLKSLEDFAVSLWVSWIFSVPFSLPCILLGIYLVWFHLRQERAIVPIEG